MKQGQGNIFSGKKGGKGAEKEKKDDPLKEEQLDEGGMPLMDHLIEFRQRILWSVSIWLLLVIVSFIFSNHTINFLLEPYYRILDNDEALRAAGIRPRAIATALYEIFFTHMKAAAFLGTVLASPMFLFQIWKFIAPGLYRNERQAIWPFLVATPFLFLLGGALVYYLIMPFAWEFFLSMQQIGEPGKINIEIDAKISEYFNTVMGLVLAFGFCFQLPVAASLMGRVGLISASAMRSARKYTILAVFVLAAVITPPDPISQLSLAIPIVILYEISIWLVHLMERPSEDEEYFEDEDHFEDQIFEKDKRDDKKN